mmetsp:Transcript_8506/g.19569  ORF Transcript_8506/g.19569 Transcript_8506/m.19569 type:complete len:119 (-) Transcript_8506:65-421(-)
MAQPYPQQQYAQQPPQQGYPQQPYGQPAPQVYVTSVNAFPTIWPKCPMPFNCPNCRTQQTSYTQTEAGLGTWLISGGICLFGGWLGCCLIPFCIDDCKDTIHKCPHCHFVVGAKKMIS